MSTASKPIEDSTVVVGPWFTEERTTVDQSSGHQDQCRAASMPAVEFHERQFPAFPPGAPPPFPDDDSDSTGTTDRGGWPRTAVRPARHQGDPYPGQLYLPHLFSKTEALRRYSAPNRRRFFWRKGSITKLRYRPIFAHGPSTSDQNAARPRPPR